jgi:hypothetical protein
VLFAVRATEDNTQVLRYSLNPETRTPALERVLFELGPMRDLSFVGSAENSLALLDGSRDELIVINSNSGERLFGARALGATWKEGSLYYFSKSEVSLFSPEDDPQELLIVRHGGIEKAVPLERTNHVAYLVGGQVFLHELDFYNNPNIHKIALPNGEPANDFLLLERDEGLLVSSSKGIFLVPLR